MVAPVSLSWRSDKINISDRCMELLVRRKAWPADDMVLELEKNRSLFFVDEFRASDFLAKLKNSFWALVTVL